YLLAVSQILAMGSRTSAADAVALVDRSIASGVIDDEDLDATIRSGWLLIRADVCTRASVILDRRRRSIPPDLSVPELDAFDGLAALRAGSVSEAVEILTTGLTRARQVGNSFARDANLAFLAHALHEADEGAALADLLAANDVDCSMRNAWTAILTVARARHLLDRGRPAQALADLTL